MGTFQKIQTDAHLQGSAIKNKSNSQEQIAKKEILKGNQPKVLLTIQPLWSKAKKARKKA